MDAGPITTEQNLPLAERLERGELAYFPELPFLSFDSETLDFLRSQRLKHPSFQSISFDPAGGRIAGYQHQSKAETERLAKLLREFSDLATGWLANQLPEYAGRWTRDRVTLRTEEEAIRSLRHNDVLHIDNFPDRPSAGRRILRLYVNINPTEPRVWQTSETFSELLSHYQSRHRIPTRSESEWCEPLTGLQRLLNRDWSGRPAYDSFMLGIHQYLRSNEDFQEKANRRLWTFPPLSSWVLFSDGLSHAVLRGQYALEHSFFIPQSALTCPEVSPLRQLVDAGEAIRLKRAG